MRVAIVGKAAQLNVSYRVVQPAHALEQHGHAVLVVLTEEARLREDALRGFDVIYVYRLMAQSTHALVRRLHRAGAAVVWDNDDDLTVNHEHGVESKVRGAMRSQMIGSLMRPMLALADVVTTPSVALATSFRDAGADDVRIVENYVAPEFDSVRREPAGDDVVVGWTAALEHLHELKLLELRETLRRLLDTHRHVRVESIGMDLGLDRDRYRAHGFVPFFQLAEYVARFDVGLAPLVDNPFNRARSNIKLKEYAALGVPWLASPIGPYAGLGIREGGRLVPDDRWYDELERIVTRPRERRRLAKRAERWARDQTIARNAASWMSVFEAALRRRRER